MDIDTIQKPHEEYMKFCRKIKVYQQFYEKHRDAIHDRFTKITEDIKRLHALSSSVSGNHKLLSNLFDSNDPIIRMSEEFLKSTRTKLQEKEKEFDVLKEKIQNFYDVLRICRSLLTAPTFIKYVSHENETIQQLNALL